VINHLQDCGKDYHEIDRVYLSQDWMTEEGAAIDDLAKPASTHALRRVLDRMVAATWPLVEEARTLPGGVKDRGLRTESAIIVSFADKLLTALGRQDPLAKRVKLGVADIALAVAGGLLRQGLFK